MSFFNAVSRRLVLPAVAALALSGCSKKVYDTTADMDNNGTEETVRIYEVRCPLSKSHQLEVSDYGSPRSAVSVKNFNLLRKPGSFQIADYDGNGLRDIGIFTFVIPQNDSLPPFTAEYRMMQESRGVFSDPR